jgi:aryl-alcohol dehydrogenase-like predicted oxidoreductase
VQSEYSLFSRDLERSVLPTMREPGVGRVAYSPLGRGFLTGAVTSLADLGEDVTPTADELLLLEEVADAVVGDRYADMRPLDR